MEPKREKQNALLAAGNLGRADVTPCDREGRNSG